MGLLVPSNPSSLHHCIVPDDPLITVDLVSALVRDQFPQWSQRAVTAVEPGGWDNRTFRLGDDLLVRLPSRSVYVPQVEKEHRWLPVLAPLLPLPIPSPVVMGKPGNGYPWPWSVYRWLEGSAASHGNVVDMDGFARDLARFLCALYSIDATGGPAAGEHNFFRGGPVGTYDDEVRRAISALSGSVDSNLATAVWEAALASRWERPGVWVHGDIAASNLLVREGRLAAVIDFGSSGVGDPACDLTLVWTFLRGSARKAFRDAMSLGMSFEDGTWARARGWALWKALIVAAWGGGGPSAVGESRRVLGEILEGDLAPR